MLATHVKYSNTPQLGLSDYITDTHYTLPPWYHRYKVTNTITNHIGPGATGFSIQTSGGGARG